MPSCAVKWCTNRSDLLIKHARISYHIFPKDPSQREEWTRTVRLERQEHQWAPSKTTRICSVHFQDDDFYTSKKGYQKLKKTLLYDGIVKFKKSNPKEGQHKDVLFMSPLQKMQINSDKENVSVKPNPRLVSCPSCGHDFGIAAHLIEGDSNLTRDHRQLTSPMTRADCNTPLNILSSDIDSAFNTSKTQKLNQEVRKKTILSEKRLSKIKSLRRRNERLIKNNVSLKDLTKELRKRNNKFIDVDVQKKLSNIASEIIRGISELKFLELF